MSFFAKSYLASSFCQAWDLDRCSNQIGNIYNQSTTTIQDKTSEGSHVLNMYVKVNCNIFTCIAICRQCLQHKAAILFRCKVTSLWVDVLALWTFPNSFLTSNCQWRLLRAVNASGLFRAVSFFLPLKFHNSQHYNNSYIRK